MALPFIDVGDSQGSVDWDRALRASAVWLALWLVPVLVIVSALGFDNVFSQIAIFFSKMAMVTFGGA